jgi:ribosome-associated translation inhibitor RaiA
MSSEVETADINLVVNGNNMDLTPALTDYVKKRIGGPLKKLGGDGIVRECDVHLSVYKNPKVSCSIAFVRRSFWRSLVEARRDFAIILLRDRHMNTV